MNSWLKSFIHDLFFQRDWKGGIYGLLDTDILEALKITLEFWLESVQWVEMEHYVYNNISYKGVNVYVQTNIQYLQESNWWILLFD